MDRNDSNEWMWAGALAVLTSAERINRPMFSPCRASHQPAWEPPVDVLELEQEVLILVALPGVDLDQVETVINEGALLVAGRRVLPPQLRTAVIHRLELPNGRFERRIPLPVGRYATVERSSLNGCLLISLQKLT